MVLKDFHCCVLEKKSDQFSIEQHRWAALVGEPGFVAQCGGYEQGKRDWAQIFGLWNDHDAYRRFMGGVHDQIFESGEQGACYIDGKSAVYERVLDMPGVAADLAGAIGHRVAMIRVARCWVHGDRIEHFVEMQRSVWKPGMSQATGMLGGGFWRCIDNINRFMVTTAWASVEDHDRYRREDFPALCRQAKTTDDLISIEGSQVSLVPTWTVLR